MSVQDTLTSAIPVRARTGIGIFDRMARHAVLSRLRALRRGELVIRDGEATFRYGQPHAAFPEPCAVEVRDPRFWRAVAFGASIGIGEAYMQGWFTTADLTGLIRLFVVNREAMFALEGGWARLRAPANRVLHWLRRNSRRGSRRNIAAHYELGNDFYEKLLDRDMMMYSCAVYPEPNSTLEEAQRAKLERICKKLELGPKHHLLEIGTGWGGLAVHAARNSGCRVTTTTISPAQAAYARRRVQDAGLSDRVTVIERDYRDLEGQYDRIVSVEMIEAVGHAHLGRFFADCDRLLKPEGTMLIQCITIDDRYYEQSRRTVDFIQRYIFPGGALPSLHSLSGAIARRTRLRLGHLEEFGSHYARTLGDWRARLLAHWGELRRMGYSETFLRMWEFYLCYCEGGFVERSIGTMQMVLWGPEHRGEPELA